MTVSLPDDVYRKAWIRTAALGASVSALVRDFLEQVTEKESEFERRRGLQQEVLASIEPFRAGDRLSRDGAHRRGAVP